MLHRLSCHCRLRKLPLAPLRSSSDGNAASLDAELGSYLDRLATGGVGLVELPLSWAELEPTRANPRWESLDALLDQVERKGLKSQLTVDCLAAPAWYGDLAETAARLECLEHGRRCPALSLWDPATLDAFDRVLGAIAVRLTDRIAAVGFDPFRLPTEYPIGQSSLSEQPLATRPRVSHVHAGRWTGDGYARASFAEAMQRRYDTLRDLNAAWKTKLVSWLDDLMPATTRGNSSDRHWHDFALWYSESVAAFCRLLADIARRHFERQRVVIRVRPGESSLHRGLFLSEVVRAAAAGGAAVCCDAFDPDASCERDHARFRPIVSAAMHYGGAFDYEIGGDLPAARTADSVYGALTAGATALVAPGDDALATARQLQSWEAANLSELPQTPVSVFWPVESDILQTEGYRRDDFEEACAAFRRLADFDLCDTPMIANGCLAAKSDLLIISGCDIPESALQQMFDFVDAGGRLWFRAGPRYQLLHTLFEIEEIRAHWGYPLRESPEPGPPGIYRFTEWPSLEPYRSLPGNRDATATLWTMHQTVRTRYESGPASLEVFDRASGDRLVPPAPPPEDAPSENVPPAPAEPIATEVPEPQEIEAMNPQPSKPSRKRRPAPPKPNPAADPALESAPAANPAPQDAAQSPAALPLKGKVALVTGGSRGLGRGIAMALAEQGAAVAVNFRTAATKAAEVVDAIHGADGKALAVRGDVSDPNDVEGIFSETLEHFGQLDFLVNNAGTSASQDIFETDLGDWNRILETNLTSSFLCCKLAMRHMAQRRTGRIVLISSVVAHQGALFGHVHYAASKSGMLGLVKTLARTAAPLGINVNAVAPGCIGTELLYENLSPRRVESLSESIPLGLGTPRDIGLAVAFLCGEGGRYITGATLDVNGGLYLR